MCQASYVDRAGIIAISHCSRTQSLQFFYDSKRIARPRKCLQNPSMVDDFHTGLQLKHEPVQLSIDSMHMSGEHT